MHCGHHPTKHIRSLRDNVLEMNVYLDPPTHTPYSGISPAYDRHIVDIGKVVCLEPLHTGLFINNEDHIEQRRKKTYAHGHSSLWRSIATLGNKVWVVRDLQKRLSEGHHIVGILTFLRLCV